MQTADILVLDFGSQYTQLIARRLREQGVYTELIAYDAPIDKIKAKNPKGLILSGGPASVYAKDAYFCDDRIFELGIPILATACSSSRINLALASCLRAKKSMARLL